MATMNKKNMKTVVVTQRVVKTNQPKNKPIKNKSRQQAVSSIKRVNVPTTVGFTSTSAAYLSGPTKVGRDTHRFTGRDYLGSYNFPYGTPAGTAIANILMNPSSGAFMNTKLSVYCRLYDKYVFRKMKFHCLPTSGTNIGASFGMAYDADMADATPPATPDGLRSYYGMKYSSFGPAWDQQELEVRKSDNQDFYYTNYTGYDGRLCAQGQLYLFCINADPNINTALNVWIEYEIDFQDPPRS